MTGEIPTLSPRASSRPSSSSGSATPCVRRTPGCRTTRGPSTRPGCAPTTSTSLADLARFPFTTKADLRENYPFGMFAVPREQVIRVHASSGTTGKPTVVGYTADDLDTWAELMARSIRAAGGRPGDVVHVAYGYGLFTGGLGAHYGAERLGCTVVPVSGGMTERQAQLIVDFRPRVIMVTPSYFLAILDELEAQGVDPQEHQSRGRDLRRRALDRRDAARGRGRAPASRPSTSTACREVMGPGVSQESGETQDGLHVWEDHFLPEIVDPFTLEPVAGRRGGGAGVHQPHQAGDAGGPLPHPRPDPPAAGHGVPGLPADAEGHRPHRRHDDRARREPLPERRSRSRSSPSRGWRRTTSAC